MPQKPVSPPSLIGSYRAPSWRIGRPLYCAVNGSLIVEEVSKAPIPWPLGRVHRVCRLTPIVTAELVEALRTESELAIMHYFGLSRSKASRLRRALGVKRSTPGTRRLWAELAPSKLPPEARRRGQAVMRRNIAARKTAKVNSRPER